MDAENLISSIHNKKIKDLISLMEKSKFRREIKSFIFLLWIELIRFSASILM